MDPDLYVENDKTYTRPGSDLRKAETRHMLNGFVSKVIDTDAGLAVLPDSCLPRGLAKRLVAARYKLRMNYRMIRVGDGVMLFGRPVREDA